MNRLIFIIGLFLCYSSFGQATDFLLFKKRDKTIGSYYTGSHITFTTTSGVFIDADITQIKNDTLYLQQFIVQQVPTTLGVTMSDTTNSYRFQVDYKEIKSISRPGNQFDLSASGASLFGGGILIAVASGVVYFADRKEYSPALLVAGASLAAVGYLIGKNSGKGMVIGRKYKLIYIDSNKKK